MNGTDLDVEFAEGSKMQVPMTGTTDEDGIKEYIEFITALDMLDNERLAWLEDNPEVDEEIEGRWSEILEGIFKDSVSTET